MIKIIYLLATLSMFGCASMSARSGESWVRYHLKNMTLKEKIGQIMVPAYAPRFYNEENHQFKRLLKLVREYKVGGVMLWRGNAYSVARSIDRLQAAAALPLLVLADMEWGLPQRVDGSTRFLENMATGATGNEEYAYEIGRITADEAKAIGIHIGLAPVMDVNSNPDNIIINTRSFGEDPALVSKMGTAFIRGLQAGGIYATAKHFPGHGDTDIDPHMFLPSITASMDRIRSFELPPFKAAVEAGVKCVMVAHITFSQVKQMGGRPSTLDPYFIKDILRKEMGFDGLVITDAMNMGSIINNYWSGEAAVMAINSGSDIVLLSPNFETTFEFVLNAAIEGRIEMGRIDEAVGRILRAKADHGLERKPVFNFANLERVMSKTKSAIKAEEISNSAMTLVRDDKNVFPFEAEKEDYLLFAGRLSPEKGPDVSIEVARRAGRRLLIAGMIEPQYEQYFNEKVKPHIDGRNVEYLGLLSQRELAPVYRKAAGVLFTISWCEPFGLVAVEAQASGTPIIATRFGALPEIILEWPPVTA